jgi:hypothetical protein
MSGKPKESEELMQSNDKASGNKEVRMELKYCEGCGGLWLRECGAGTVYCRHCEDKVMDLPRLSRRKAKLPVGKRPATDNYDLEACGELQRWSVAGGAA